MKFLNFKKRNSYIRKLKPIFRIVIPLLGVTAVLLWFAKYLTSSEYFSIKQYSHSGINKFVNVADFKKIVENNIIGKNILLLDINKLEQVLKTSFLGIRNIEVRKELPDKLSIIVQERFPTAIIENQNGEKYLADIDGYILGLVGDSYYDLPLVKYTLPIYIGQFVEKSVVPITAEIVKEAGAEKINISSISYEPGKTYVWVQSGVLVVVDNAKNIRDAFKIVSEILAQSENADKKPISIDLRYDKVIVLYD